MLELRLTDPDAPALSVAGGHCLGLFGPSGAGKTSLARAIAGLPVPVTPLRSVMLEGQDLSRHPAHTRRIGMVFQRPRLFPHMTVARNIDYGTHASPNTSPLPDSVRTDLIRALRLNALLTRLPRTLSGGEQARVALARALLAAPAALILDEPFTGIDHGHRAELLSVVRDHAIARNLPMILITHDPDEIAALCDRVALIAGGRLLEEGPTEQVTLRDGGDPAGTEITVLAATVRTHHADDHLTELDLHGQPMFVRRVAGAPGELIRVRIAATDVALSRAPAENISVLNQLRCRVLSTDISEAYVTVRLALDGDNAVLTARLTRRGWARVGGQTGDELFALVKSVATSPGGTRLSDGS